jgi:hypothetical protein
MASHDKKVLDIADRAVELEKVRLESDQDHELGQNSGQNEANDPSGQATCDPVATSAMFAVGWLQLGDRRMALKAKRSTFTISDFEHR